MQNKIDFLINALKESYCVVLDGVVCCFNKYETFENKDKIDCIYFDDVTMDDAYSSIDLNDIKDIELIGSKFKIVMNNNDYRVISILVIKKFEKAI